MSAGSVPGKKQDRSRSRTSEEAGLPPVPSPGNSLAAADADARQVRKRDPGRIRIEA